LFAAPDFHWGLGQPPVDKLYLTFPPLTGIRAVGTIATEEGRKPGRKLLLWIGPGLTSRLMNGAQTGTGQFPDRDYDHYDPVTHIITRTTLNQTGSNGCSNDFGRVYWFSTLLRQARMSLLSFSVGEDGPGAKQIEEAMQCAPTVDPLSARVQPSDAWQLFVGGVHDPQRTSMMSLYKKVLAIQTGGHVMPPSEDLADQIAGCVAEAGTFYTLTFDPPLAARDDEYHSLKVELSQPGLTSRAIAGYYGEPFYTDPPDARLQQMTVAQFEQMIHSAHGMSDIERRLATVKLTERLSAAKMAILSAELHGSKARDALKEVADESEFLPTPPSAEISVKPPPDQAAQQRLLALAIDYLDHILPKLPNFFASRTALRFGERAAYHEVGTKIDAVPLHVEEESKATVLYRHGEKIVDATSLQGKPTEDRRLSTFGTFRPLLRMVRSVMSTTGNLTWSRWELGNGGQQAVFRYAVPSAESLYEVAGCCLPEGDGTTRFRILPAYHGEIAIDSASGAILRVQLQTDLQGFVPAERSDMMVVYSPVQIDGRTYVLPVRGLNVWRGRSVQYLKEWNEGFQTWGPYETQMNDLTFDHDHIFSGEVRILPDFTQAP
jgi:hypothetical protein